MTNPQRISLGLLLAAPILVLTAGSPLLRLPLRPSTQTVLLLIVGVAAAEVYLAGCWLALAQRPWLARCIEAVLYAYVLSAALLASAARGTQPVNGWQALWILVDVNLAIGLVAVALVVPPLGGRWRILPAVERNDLRSSQFGLRYLFGIILVTACLLTSARFLRLEWVPGRPLRDDDVLELVTFHGMVLVFVIAEFLLALPLAARCFGPRTADDHATTLAVFVPMYALALSAATLPIIGLVNPLGPRRVMQTVAIVLTFHFAAWFTFAGTLIALRQIGIRLERRRDRQGSLTGSHR